MVENHSNNNKPIQQLKTLLDKTQNQQKSDNSLATSCMTNTIGLSIIGNLTNSLLARSNLKYKIGELTFPKRSSSAESKRPKFELFPYESLEFADLSEPLFRLGNFENAFLSDIDQNPLYIKKSRECFSKKFSNLNTIPMGRNADAIPSEKSETLNINKFTDAKRLRRPLPCFLGLRVNLIETKSVNPMLEKIVASTQEEIDRLFQEGFSEEPSSGSITNEKNTIMNDNIDIDNKLYNSKYNKSKSSRPSKKGKKFYHHKIGDWLCMFCLNINFIRRAECNRCLIPKYLSTFITKSQFQ